MILFSFINEQLGLDIVNDFKIFNFILVKKTEQQNYKNNSSLSMKQTFGQK